VIKSNSARRDSASPDGWRDEAGEHKEEQDGEAHGDDDGFFAHRANIDIERARTRRGNLGPGSAHGGL
jgi:hypothetical protein